MDLWNDDILREDELVAAMEADHAMPGMTLDDFDPGDYEGCLQAAWTCGLTMRQADHMVYAMTHPDGDYEAGDDE